MARLFTRSGDSIAQHRKSNKCLHKTFGWILVETADFKNRGIMLQWCLFVEREENYALYNGRGGCHLLVFECAFGAGRCGSVCAETKRRVSARCRLDTAYLDDLSPDPKTYLMSARKLTNRMSAATLVVADIFPRLYLLFAS